MSMGQELRGFDMEKYVEHNFQNATHSIEVLRGRKYWLHFDVVANCYSDLFKFKKLDVSRDPSVMARIHFLGGCSVNLVKGISNVLSGHFTDSSIYIRRTIESVRYCSFIRENPQIAKVWFAQDGKEEFGETYRKWLQAGGKKLVESEMPDSIRYFDHASSYGPHSNAQLFSHQHEVIQKDGIMDMRIFYHDLEPSERGYHGLLALFFWHLRVHYQAIDWWIYKSALPVELSIDQKSFWTDCRNRIRRDHEDVRKILASGPLAKL